MHRLAILTAATLTLSVACGDNQYVPVEVDDDSTADFERATVDVGRRAISDDYVMPGSIFSYARAGLSDRVQWADKIGGLGYPGPLSDITTGERVDDDIATIEYVLYEMSWSPLAQGCSGFSTAPNDDRRDELGTDGLTHQAPEKATADQADDSPSPADVTTGEALVEDLSCGAPIDNNDTDLGGVCGCSDLDCVADFVNETMGCDVCMTFVCGDELLGACAACAP